VTGTVYLVGAGPGDPKLITVRGAEVLGLADVVVFDRLASPALLDLAPTQAERIYVGKEPGRSAMKQEAINELLVRLAAPGRRVVRLKGGDPAVFGRAGEEIEACRAHGIPVRTIPGITAALAAASALTISLTHRRHAQRVQFVTGHDRRGELPSDLDLDALADPRATTCVYMGRETARALSVRLIERGLHPATPVAVVANVSRPDEQAAATTLGEVAEGVSSFPGDGPTLVLIGHALDGRGGSAVAAQAAEPAVAPTLAW
jgi:uroporphyrin-III C-methyltransferase/precorrin-2 dehydrogenase/sirohydrochlorin ferrochelatase